MLSAEIKNESLVSYEKISWVPTQTHAKWNLPRTMRLGFFMHSFYDTHRRNSDLSTCYKNRLSPQSLMVTGMELRATAFCSSPTQLPLATEKSLRPSWFGK
jgi:hypothetical protein